jgi:hypothetical protein
MVAADSTLRKTVARLCASFQISDRDASRLQCSLAKIAAPSGPNGWSPAGDGVAVAGSAWGAGTRWGAAACPVSPVASIAGLLEPLASLAVGRVTRNTDHARVLTALQPSSNDECEVEARSRPGLRH